MLEEFVKSTEIDGLLNWSRVMAHYMGIALEVSKNDKLAEIAIGKTDMDVMERIVKVLEEVQHEQ